jgi:hypothetical protein
MLTNLHARSAGLAALAALATTLSQNWPTTAQGWGSVIVSTVLSLTAMFAPNSASAPGSN